MVMSKAGGSVSGLTLGSLIVVAVVPGASGVLASLGELWPFPLPHEAATRVRAKSQGAIRTSLILCETS